jgi:hypothetical protein
MAIRSLNSQQHIEILNRLVHLAKSAKIKQLHHAGPEYTSLMVCFLNHCLMAADSLLHLHESFGDEYFPTTVGYIIVRPMFEIDVTAHYITKDPSTRAHQYIEYDSVLKKHQMDACKKHRQSKKPDWREGMEMVWNHGWAPIENQVKAKYDAVCSHFSASNNGKTIRTWSGKSIRQMAIEVDHEEAYDIFYADLSSFTHADVRLADRFLRLKPKGMSWTLQAHEVDTGGVFRYAVIFLSCFLTLFGEEFKLWTKEVINTCLG